MTRTTDDRITPAGQIQAMTRRQALARLGLGASVAYATPILLNLGAARASGGSGGGGGGGNEGGHGSGPGNDHSSDSQGASHEDVAQLSSPTSPSGPDDSLDDSSGDDSSGGGSSSSGTILFGEPGSGQP